MVKSIREAVLKIVFSIRSEYKGTVVGICGSSGKSTIAYLIKKLIAIKYKPLETPYSLDAVWGMTLELIYNCSRSAFTILEMGRLSTNQLPPMTLVAQPQIFIVSSISSGYRVAGF